MKISKQLLTKEDILNHWKQGKSSLDWRLLTEGEKRQWLTACVLWSGLPKNKIVSFVYTIDGNQVSSYADFFCLLGETFFGYRGYFGQDTHGFEDCFTEIFLQTKSKETVEEGAVLRIINAEQVKEAFNDDFEYILDIFRVQGFLIELE